MTFPKPTGNPQRARARARQRAYSRLRKTLTDHPSSCGVCGKVGHLQAHHRRGRDGDRLTNPEDIMLVCPDCHRRIHANPAWAYEAGHMLRRTT